MKFRRFFSTNALVLIFSAIVLITVTAAWAQTAIVDDCEGGTNINKFGAPWYFYDDSTEGGNSKIAGVTRDATGKIIGVAPAATQGNAGTAGYQINYTMGTVKAFCRDAITHAIIPGCGYNYLGVGTMLAPEGKTCDLTGATAITFWAKASPSVKLNVEVATTEVNDLNYYRTIISVGASWTQYTILLAPGIGIAQQVGWGMKVDFNPAHVTSIHWQVHSDQTPPAAGSLNLDDVAITNYTFTPPEVCKGCLTMSAPATKVLLSDFEGTLQPVNANAAGGWWYCYNDGVGRTDITSRTDYSDINAGVTVDPTLPLGKAPTIAISSHGKTGNGAYIGFQLGKTFTQGGVTKPFVGIGTSLTDALGTMYYNGTADGVTGIMFDYLITGVDYLRLEVISSNDISAQGIVWSRLLPKGTVWQTAVVPFDSLKLPDWDNVKAMDPTLTMLKKNELKKIQFAVQDAPGLQGTIAIDNVYLIGASKITPIGATPVPDVPVLSSPATNTTGTASAITLTWGAASGAVSYTLQVSTAANFSSFAVNAGSITATSYNLTGLANDTTYYWRVRAVNGNGVSAWSSVWSFTRIILMPAVPVPVSPISGAINVPIDPVMVWHAAANAESYKVQVSTTPDFIMLVKYMTVPADTSVIVTGLTNGTKYYGRVNASNAGGTSNWSAAIDFTMVAANVAVLPGQIQLLSFTCNGSSGTIRYSLPDECFVSLNYYDIRGKLVASFVNQSQKPGYYLLSLPLSTWPRGTYIQVFTAGNFIKKEMVVVVR